MEISLLHMYMQKNTNKEDSFYVCVWLVFPFGKSHLPSGFARGHPVSTSTTIPECHWSSITSIASSCILEYNMILNSLVEHQENLKTMSRSSISGQVLCRRREI